VQERVIGKRPDGSRLVIVGPDSRLFLRKRVERLGRRANQDTHYDFGVYHAQESWTREADVHGVVAVTPDHRGVAVGLFEKRSLRLVTTWEEWSAPTPLGDSSAVPGGFWTVGFVWTLVTYRRQGLGRW